MVAVVALALALGLVVVGARRSGMFAPSTMFSFYCCLSLFTFTIVHLFGITQDDVIFSAMPLPSFDGVATVTAVQYLFLVAIGFVSGLGLREDPRRDRRVLSSTMIATAQRTVSGPAAWGGFLVLYVMSAIHFYDMDASLIWRNYSYLLIKNPDTIGIDSLIARLYHVGFRFVGLLCVPLCVYYFVTKKYSLGVVSSIFLLYATIILLAANSRWVPLYFFCGFIVYSVLRRNMINVTNVVLILGLFLSFLKVLIGRSQIEQGLSQTFHDLSQVSFSLIGTYFVGFLINVSDGALNFANSLIIAPLHDFTYRVLSFSPLISEIDGFSGIRAFSEIRLSVFVPMSAVSEVFAFGIAYALVFYGVVIFWLRCTTWVFCRLGGGLALLFAIPSYWMTFAIQQYSVRTSWRLVLVLAAGAWLTARWSRSRGPAEDRGTASWRAPAPGRM